ncbi:MAG: TIGR04211 family SH3 domain-containing protein [Gammaproteobacteria bacterium]|nr:TIGR04211 family SH3 domain-containing protein [Gammaproteobacteria bacterium]NNC68322.1 TIGR04211 family SH3 domain-containing protein [Gammaproteobacteria bacterium]
MFNNKNAAKLALMLATYSASVYAEDLRYVTDELEITMHRKMSLNSEIVAQLKSGTPVRVLKTNRDEGYVMVATKDEKVGWMLESFLINEPAGRQQYESLKIEYDKLKAEFDLQVKERTSKLSKELTQVKNAAKRPLELQQENQKLKNTLEQERAQVEEIKKENQQFKSIHKDRQWFAVGAITAIGSLVLGLIITRVPWRRRKSWGEL